MSLHKIQPWNLEPDDGEGYMKKLQHLSNFSSHKNINKIHDKKQYALNVGRKMKKFGNTNQFANTSLQNFNKTNRSEYKHRVTKLVFNSENSKKKYKFAPDGQYAKKIIKVSSYQRLPRPTMQMSVKRLEKLKTEPKKSRKQIYYHLTEMNYPFDAVTLPKCNTDSNAQDDIRKVKITSIFKKDRLEQFISRELSVERKIYILQSGKKNLLSQQQHYSKKNIRKRKNIIEGICFADSQFLRRETKEKKY